MNLNENISRVRELMGIILEETSFGTMDSEELMKEPEKKYYIDKSDIQGQGVFAKKDLKKGEIIGLLHVIKKLGSDYDFTELGRLHNHSDSPTCHNVLINNKRFLVASKDLKKGQELTTDYTLQPDLEQPRPEWKLNENNQREMIPYIDGYRTYSPFKEMDYIIVPGNGIDCDNIVWDLVLLGDDGSIVIGPKNSGAHYLKNASMVVELPLKNGEDLNDLTSDENKLKKWVHDYIENVDTKFEIRNNVNL